MFSTSRKIKMLPVREQVASILRSAIHSGEIEKGQSITLDSVGDMVGVSRTPVREAFHILANEGLIELRQNRCAIVKGVSIEAIKDHYEIRILLETDAVRRACENMNEDILKTLQEVAKQGEEAKKSGDTEAFSLANQAFHMVIWEAAKSEKLKSFLSSLWNGLSMNRVVSAQEYTNSSQNDHETLIQKIIDKDYEEACSCMKEHIIRSMNSTLANFNDEKAEN
jgi:DNA-binding GntR family transcriptional regulator